MRARFIDVPFAQIPHEITMSEEFWETERRGKPVSVDTTPHTGETIHIPYKCRPLFRVDGVKVLPPGAFTLACACFLDFPLTEYEHVLDEITAPDFEIAYEKV